MICFDYKELEPWEVVRGLYEERIEASTRPYRRSYARLAPSLINNEEEIQRSQEIERSLAVLTRL